MALFHYITPRDDHGLNLLLFHVVMAESNTSYFIHFCFPALFVWKPALSYFRPVAPVADSAILPTTTLPKQKNWEFHRVHEWNIYRHLP